jgi:hypothetical protein
MPVYIGFWTLEMKYMEYGICGEVAFKNARTTVFLEVGLLLENPNFFVGNCSSQKMPTLKGS